MEDRPAQETVDPGVFDKRRVDEAIEHVCDYFHERGLTLYETWHVCTSVEKATLAVMGEHVRESRDG
jgi:hypothetical protein